MQTSVLSEGIFLAYVPLRLQPSENVSAFLIPCQWLRGFENSLPNSQVKEEVLLSIFTVAVFRMEIRKSGAVRQFSEHPDIDPDEKRNRHGG